MTWNWENPDWPNFTFDSSSLGALEQRFLLQSGELIGVYKHLSAVDREALKIELISEEAIMTSEIEGETLDRDSVRSSLRAQFGLGDEKSRVKPAERGIAKMLAELHHNFAGSLTEAMLFDWRALLLADERATTKAIGIGGYRTHSAPMQVLPDPGHKPRVDFVAPPPTRVPGEMARFIVWFNDSGPGGVRPLPALTRAALAHLYFVSVHPFEDGNGPIARAIAEKSLAQSLGQPSLIALACTIERRREDYHRALQQNNRELAVDGWMRHFANMVLEAQNRTIEHVEFYVAKAKFYEKFRHKLNERQAKVIARMFREGIDGFKGGLSAEAYIGICKTSRATATRDLQDLVKSGALTRTGELRHTRYSLNLSSHASK